MNTNIVEQTEQIISTTHENNGYEKVRERYKATQQLALILGVNNLIILGNLI